MIRPGDRLLANELRTRILAFDAVTPLPGIHNPANLDCFVEQIIDSVRRVKYVTTIRNKVISPICADPHSATFDPIKAAIWHFNNGNIDEAYWLIFLLTHFGKNKSTNWELLKAVYGNLGDRNIWNWRNASNNPHEFSHWIDDNKIELNLIGKFGNHRKFESLNFDGTGTTIITYIAWVGTHHNHKFRNELQNLNNPREKFNRLYNSLNSVHRFGRMAKFDYLTMLGKLNFIEIEPGSTFMQGATGPYTGSCLLFSGDFNTDIDRAVINRSLGDLETTLELYFGMQVLEDAICNWQKSPDRYIHFVG
ncbi:MAG: hypothetical protein JWR02_2593 [Mucilaginibacter sp.]|nr:hypothetical protein [Mucilaginibacter sp.]